MSEPWWVTAIKAVVVFVVFWFLVVVIFSFEVCHESVCASVK